MIKYWCTLLYLFFSISVHTQEAFETIPIDLVKNLIFIEVQINDIEKPSHFMFDSGAGITVMDEKYSQKIELIATDKTKIGTSGKTITAKLSSNNKIKIGNELVLDDITFAIMDLSHLSKYLKTNVDGIIGSDFLQNLVIETNTDEKVIRFYSPNNFNYKGNGTALELLGLESGHLGLPIEIVFIKNNKPLNLIFKIDTGAANYLTFHNESVTKYNLVDSNKKNKVKKGFGADATITNNLSGKMYSAKLSGKEWKKIPVVFEVDSLNKSSKRLADGLIGQEMLLDFNITYNLKEGLIYLEKIK